MRAEERADYVVARYEPHDPPERLHALVTAAVLVAEVETLEAVAGALGMHPRYLMAMIGRLEPVTAGETV